MKARIETKLTLTGIAVTATWVLMSALMGKSIVTDNDNQSDVDFEFVTGASYAISDCPEIVNSDLYVYEPHSWFAESRQALIQLLRH